MTKRDVEIQSSFPKCLGQIPIMGIVKMVVQLKADPQHGISYLVFSLPNIKQGLAEIPAHVECWPDVRIMILVSALVKFLAQLPATFPSHFVSVPGSRIAENSFSVDRTHSCKGIT